ncbi:MAG: circadian clock protein, KaiC, partial [Methanohalophilus sp.]
TCIVINGVPMERLSTGIQGLDKKIGDGYPGKKGILITGAPGSGKTIFAMHAINQACTDGKKSVIMATEETEEDITEQAKIFGFPFDEYIKSGLLEIVKILEMRSRSVTKAAEMIDGLSFKQVDLINMPELIPYDAEVIVMDNIGVFAIGLTPREFRDQFDTLNLLLSQKDVTTLFVMDEAAHQMTHEVADYSTFGNIKLMVKENPYTGKMERFIFIPKMRNTAISLDPVPFEITSKGIDIKGKKDT